MDYDYLLGFVCWGHRLAVSPLLKVILSVCCVGESHNPTPQYVALTLHWTFSRTRCPFNMHLLNFQIRS